MERAGARPRGRATNTGRTLLGLALVCALAVMAGCTRETPVAQAPASPSDASSTSQTAPSAPAVVPEAPLKPLKAEPEVALVGQAVRITAEGLPPGKPADLVWNTSGGSYQTKRDLGSIEFLGLNYESKRLPLGRATVDAQGRLDATLAVPEDYGELHDVFVLVDGREVAKGGLYVNRVATVSPLSGPVGAPITIEIKGLGASAFQNTAGVRWDNKYLGFMSSTTTAGTAKAVIRAAGPPGEHFIDIGPASAAVPYLNPQQTPRRVKIPTFRFAFTVTEDQGAPAAELQWPDADRVAATPTLPLNPEKGAGPKPGASARMSPASGPILSRTILEARGLTPNAEVDLVWMTVTGSDVTGWSGADQPLSKVRADKDGNVSASIEIPEGLGGWHSLTLVGDGQMVAHAPFFVERSLVGVSPGKVKAGEKFTVQIKGVGWTELDNGVAVLYDNNYVGYACGFGSGGDVTVELVATGGPGTHLIELYPMIYNRGFSQKYLWDYQVPQLTFAKDHPGLGLGYKLPVFRLAVEVTP